MNSDHLTSFGRSSPSAKHCPHDIQCGLSEMLITSMDSCCQRKIIYKPVIVAVGANVSLSQPQLSFPAPSFVIATYTSVKLNWSLLPEKVMLIQAWSSIQLPSLLSSFIYWMPHLFRLNISISSCVRHFLGGSLMFSLLCSHSNLCRDYLTIYHI